MSPNAAQQGVNSHTNQQQQQHTSHNTTTHSNKRLRSEEPPEAPELVQLRKSNQVRVEEGAVVMGACVFLLGRGVGRTVYVQGMLVGSFGGLPKAYWPRQDASSSPHSPALSHTWTLSNPPARTHRSCAASLSPAGRRLSGLRRSSRRQRQHTPRSWQTGRSRWVVCV